MACNLSLKHCPFSPNGAGRKRRAVAVVGPCCALIAIPAMGQGVVPRSPSQLDVPDAYRQIESEQRKESLDPKTPS